MSKNRIHGLRVGGRIASAGAVASVAIGLLSAGAANADAFVPLPDGAIEGPGVTITHVGESALVSPSMADNGVGRVVWVTGNARADVRETPTGTAGPNNGTANLPGANNSSTHGTSRLSAGYVIGCQVSIASDSISAGAGVSLSSSAAGLSGSFGIKMGPGDIKYVEIDGKDVLTAGQYSVKYKDVQMEIQGCGGYAQARSYTVVEIIGNDYSKTVLYGMPFSIG